MADLEVYDAKDVIRRRTEECWDKFQILSSLIHEFEQDLPLKSTAQDLDDEFEHFRVWARNLGACSIEQTSLDCYLRDSSTTQATITIVLGGLKSNLDRCKLLFRGENYHHCSNS